MPAESFIMNAKGDISGIIRSLGLVFGDIGTSPIYTITVIFLLLPRTEANVIGVLSLIVWTLLILVTMGYAWLAMSISKRGEGGTIVLREVLGRYVRPGRQAAFITLLSFIGISLLVGDGVITPAISILSAVEGMLLIPGFETTSRETLIVIAGAIAVLLFAFQRKGAEKVAGTFGPIMVVWFIVLFITGLASIAGGALVIKALNPWNAISFILHNGVLGFFVLSEVILCATGAEALYADMGHLGKTHIMKGWYIVLTALLVNYLGQGAYIIANPGAGNVLFEMVRSQAGLLYVPFLILSLMATVIASQAMISGIFSIVYQGITTHIMPMFKVDYTSTRMQSQIYIGAANWFLLIAVLFVINEFRESSRLAAAYGLAATGTMTITGTMMTWLFYLRGKALECTVAAVITSIEIAFLISCAYKIPHGGYLSLLIAAVPLSMILIYTKGQKRLHKKLRPLNADAFLISYREIYEKTVHIRGTAVFFARDVRYIPTYIVHTMFINNIVYEDNIIVSISVRREPFGLSGVFKDDLAPGLRAFEITAGYMELFDVEEMMKNSGIEEKVIFYGIEEIVAGNVVWKIFSMMKKLTPSFVQFYKLPARKIHGVVMRVEM